MHEPNKILRRIAVCAALALLAGSAWGQKPKIVGQERPGTVEDWEQRIRLAEQRFRAGDFKKTRDISDALVREMLHTIESGPGVGPIVGQTLTLRALGAAGRNKTREALWDWHSARVMNPKLTDADLAAYGPVGEALLKAAETEGFLPRKSDRPRMPDREAATQQGAERVTRPKKIKGEMPAYPLALKTLCTQGIVALEAVIDQEGNVVAPTQKDSPSPILTLAALEALRTWRFKPAVYQGKPVAVYYTLSMGFKTTCLNPAAAAAQDQEDG